MVNILSRCIVSARIYCLLSNSNEQGLQEHFLLFLQMIHSFTMVMEVEYMIISEKGKKLSGKITKPTGKKDKEVFIFGR